MKLLPCSFVVSVILMLIKLPLGALTTPPLCCTEPDEILDKEVQKCVKNPSIQKLGEIIPQNSDPVFVCSNGWDSFKLSNLTENTAIERLSTPISESVQKCIYSILHNDGYNETVVAFCRPPTIQLKKCCPARQSVNRSSIGECVLNDNQVFNASKVVRQVPYEIVDNSSLSCSYGYNIYVPKMFVDNFYFVDPSNHLVVPRSMYKILGKSNEYCVDTYVNQNGNEEDIAIICLPWRMHILRYLLRVIYPHLHFISAFFLLLTLMVYLVFPPLRDNIQGYSMICFLLCMIVVQTEYGVLLALPYEPHTWCFFKTQASNYFRYASSTWITVMGFNIWYTLSHGPKPNSKRELLIRFSLLSVYAWGVPLALQMAVIIYRNSLGPPVQLCWFGNPVLKSLLSTPNVILVTANLIFFIPSALKVYGSLRFLKTSVSPVALNKLEKQRITTIFRFFLLMQFYTIPRIVHEIVDSDNASPELLMFSVSLYTLIGPAMFYFFVCKVEIFKMIKELSSDLKKSSTTWLSIKRTTISKPIGSVKRFWRSESYKTSSSELHSSDISSTSTVKPVRYNTKGEDNPSFSQEYLPPQI